MNYKSLFIIPGNSLYDIEQIPGGISNMLFFMAEDKGLCSHYKYHKHKLILIISAMRSYRDRISNKHEVEYHQIDDTDSELTYEEKLLRTVRKYRISEILSWDIENHFFKKRVEDFCCKNNLKLHIYDSPGFITTHEQFSEYISSHERLFLNEFYIWQRKRLDVLLSQYGGPLNRKWSFDTENRKKLPANVNIPDLPVLNKTQNTTNVSRLVNDLYPENPGSSNNFYLPTTREQSVYWMNDFFEHRFSRFGPYQDAIASNNCFNFHSVISPLLNIGLLTPDELISGAIEYRDKIPFQSIEGFIRQIIGWREFIRGVYNTVDMRKNFFNHRNKMNSRWYDGTTGLFPLDVVIKRVISNAYAHHIERLMILSNVMLLCEIDPVEVNNWFMEFFVDSADWVMVPNVYGMGQYADGGSFATKPYISGSNYILKMSDFRKGNWCDVWDGLYWKFISKNRQFFSSNKRMSMMISMLDRMDNKKKERLFGMANEFTSSVTC